MRAEIGTISSATLQLQCNDCEKPTEELTEEEQEHVKIITNGHWHNFKDQNDVPKHVLDSEFDYLNGDATTDFLCYRGTWFHLDDFIVTGAPTSWHGVYQDTAFSATVIRISNDNDQYQIGSVIW